MIVRTCDLFSTLSIDSSISEIIFVCVQVNEKKNDKKQTVYKINQLNCRIDLKKQGNLPVVVCLLFLFI